MCGRERACTEIASRPNRFLSTNSVVGQMIGRLIRKQCDLAVVETSSGGSRIPAPSRYEVHGTPHLELARRDFEGVEPTESERWGCPDRLRPDRRILAGLAPLLTRLDELLPSSLPSSPPVGAVDRPRSRLPERQRAAFRPNRTVLATATSDSMNSSVGLGVWIHTTLIRRALCVHFY